MESLWVELCSVQVSPFIRKDGAWVPAEYASEWSTAVLCRSDSNCRIRIGEEEKEEPLNIIMSAGSTISLAAQDFAEIKISASSGIDPDAGRYGMYFIDGDEASEFVSLACSAINSLTPNASDGQNQKPASVSDGAAKARGSQRRKSLSQFPEVNEAVDNTLVATDNGGVGDYSGTVSGLLGRVANSATGMLRQLTVVSSGSAEAQLSEEETTRTTSVASPLPGPPSVFPFAGANESAAASASASAEESTSSCSGPQDAATAPTVHTSGISAPMVVKHDVKVSYDFYKARYVGLPAAWKDMNRCFGLTYDASPKVRLAEYESRIPAVLEMLKRHFLELNGQDTVGIFRLSANKEKVDQAKTEINTGLFEGCTDVHLISNLIKIYFRDMPKSLLNCVPERAIHQVADTVIVASDQKCYDAVHAHMESFAEPHRSMLYWLLDLMCVVTLHEDTNKMGCKNIAIVLSPNLYSVNTENAMYALTMSQKVADFTTKCLAARLKLKHNYQAAV